MSMTTLTLWQLVGIFCAYLFVMVGLPAFVFGKKLHGHRAPERFMLYFMTGNFFVMNLVFVLQLLKISYPVTLILGTLLVAIIAKVKINHIPVKEVFLSHAEKLRRLAGGRMGTKTAIYNLGAGLRDAIYRFCSWVEYYLFQRFLDCVLIILLLTMLWYIYGTNLVEYFGYKASDLLVHNYWINSLGDNDIFVAGVYPHGFHCVLYYLHAVFGIETFVLLRVFAFVQNVMVNLMLLLVMRLCCRSRFVAYVGSYAYVIGSYFRLHTYTRYYATLPQEYGIMFILPAIYFGFAFFEARRQEIKAEKEELPADDAKETTPELEKAEKSLAQRFSKRLGKSRIKRIRTSEIDLFSPSNLCLAGFCMSFSMTLAVHFYGTMVAGLFCLAMACGYCFLLFRKKYFWKVVITATLSMVIAVLPMLLAFIGGTPLEGSLRWGMSIIQTSNDTADQQEETIVDDSPEHNSSSGESVPGEDFTGTNSGEIQLQEQVVKISMAEHISQIRNKVKQIWIEVENILKAYVFSLPYDDGVHWIMISFLGLIGLGCFYILARRVCYGAMLVSTGLYMFFMCVMMGARVFGLPSLMDGSRGSVYFSYTYPLAFTLTLDAALYLPFFLLRGKVWKMGRVFFNGLSLVCVFGFLYYTVLTGQVRSPWGAGAQEMNESVICLTNIIKNEDDFAWTIVSANDETRMGWDHGFHYETITFLQEMEAVQTDTLIRIPTPVVFFFIEKIPLDYGVVYLDSGQTISEEGAVLPLPKGNGLNVYQGVNRWIVMSRMYYWAETFRQLCPNEMEIYMETDNFICYRLEQDPYRLYNFALDYGYNDWGNVAEETAD